MLERPDAVAAVKASFAVHPAVAIAGPRQCGKTTLAGFIAAQGPGSTYLDLEKAVDLHKLDAPEQALSPLKGLVVIDEEGYPEFTCDGSSRRPRRLLRHVADSQKPVFSKKTGFFLRPAVRDTET